MFIDNAECGGWGGGGVGGGVGVGVYASERVKYFKRYASDKLINAKIKMGSNSVITCNRVTVLALSLMAVSQCIRFHLILLYFQR